MELLKDFLHDRYIIDDGMAKKVKWFMIDKIERRDEIFLRVNREEILLVIIALPWKFVHF